MEYQQEKANREIQHVVLRKGAVQVPTMQAKVVTVSEVEPLEGIFLFATPTCPNCKTAKRMLDEAGIQYQVIDAFEKPDMAETFHVQAAPSLVVVDKGHTEQTFATIQEIRGFCKGNNKN